MTKRIDELKNAISVVDAIIENNNVAKELFENERNMLLTSRHNKALALVKIFPVEFVNKIVSVLPKGVSFSGYRVDGSSVIVYVEHEGKEHTFQFTAMKFKVVEPCVGNIVYTPPSMWVEIIEAIKSELYKGL